MANATAMSRVLDIVSQASREDKVIIISSAISGATDLLIKASTASASQKAEILDGLKHRHFEIIDRLFTGKEQRYQSHHFPGRRRPEECSRGRLSELRRDFLDDDIGQKTGSGRHQHTVAQFDGPNSGRGWSRERGADLPKNQKRSGVSSGGEGIRGTGLYRKRRDWARVHSGKRRK